MTINDLTIDIKADASKAVKQIDSLTQSLRNLQNVLNGQWRNPLHGMTFPNAPNGGRGGGGNAGAATARTATAARRASRSTNDLTASFRRLQRQTRSLLSPLLSLPRAFARIAFYRAIRTALKVIGEAFKEGGENAYWYSKLYGEGTKYISEALDALSSANFKATNQLGAAWVTLKAALAPIFISLLGMVTNLAARITELFAAINGKTVFLKAKDYTKDAYENTAAGAKAAKEWKNQLMGFDVINRLEEPSSGGGGSGSATPDYENMFEEAAVSADTLSKLERAKEILGDIKETVTGIVEMVKNGDWGGIAGKISGWLNGILNAVSTFIANTNFGEVSRNLFGGITNFLNGFDIGGFTGSLGTILSGLMTSLGDFIANIPLGPLIDSIYDFLIRAFMGVDWLGLLKSAWYLASAVLSQLPSLLMSLMAGVIDSIAAFVEVMFEAPGQNAVSGFIRGVSQKIRDARDKLQVYIDAIVQFVKSILGIHSPSTVFAEIGENVVQGLWDGVKEKWEKVKSWFNTNVAKFFTASYWTNKLQGALGGLSNIHIKLPHLKVEWEPVAANNFLSKIFGFTSIPHLSVNWYANGGFPEDGLFMANHSELVGKFSNGKTAVANNEQITQGIARAVYDAFTSAMGDGRSDDKPIVIMLDGKEVARSTTKYQRQMARAGGV